MIISINHQKGGVGKSTIAFNLAVELAKDYKVEIVDLDVQRTITATQKIRSNNENLKPLKINYLNNESEFESFFKNKDKDTLYIFDTGGFDSSLNRNAIYFSDLVITPVSDKFNEVSGLMKFKEILEELEEVTKSDMKVHVLLNNINPQIKKFDSIKAFLNSNKEFALLDSILKTRVDYDKASWLGKSVFEYNKDSKASEEFKSLIDEIKTILKLKK